MEFNEIQSNVVGYNLIQLEDPLLLVKIEKVGADWGCLILSDIFRQLLYNCLED